jgi:hypothetical protein
MLPNRFYLKKKNYEEIRWSFIIEMSHVKDAEACKNQYDSSFLIFIAYLSKWFSLFTKKIKKQEPLAKYSALLYR